MPNPMQKAPSMLMLYINALRKKTKAGFDCHQALPPLSLTLENQSINKKQLAQYNQICGFADHQSIPASFLQVLSFPLQMALLTDPQMPIAAMGLVHLSNTIHCLKPVDPKEILTIQCAIKEQRLTAKGLSFDINAHINNKAGELIYVSTATLLYRCKTGIEKEESTVNIEPFNSNHKRWEISGNTGRLYGKASLDLNPIHLFALSAKLFGFKRQIAHGLYLNAHSLAAIEGELPATPFTISTEFKRPAFIPSQFNFYSQIQQHEKSIQIWSKDHKDLHLTANISATNEELYDENI